MREAVLMLLTPEQKATAAGRALVGMEEQAARTRGRLPKIATPGDNR